MKVQLLPRLEAAADEPLAQDVVDLVVQVAVAEGAECFRGCHQLADATIDTRRDM